MSSRIKKTLWNLANIKYQVETGKSRRALLTASTKCILSIFVKFVCNAFIKWRIYVNFPGLSKNKLLVVVNAAEIIACCGRYLQNQSLKY